MAIEVKDEFSASLVAAKKDLCLTKGNWTECIAYNNSPYFIATAEPAAPQLPIGLLLVILFALLLQPFAAAWLVARRSRQAKQRADRLTPFPSPPVAPGADALGAQHLTRLEALASTFGAAAEHLDNLQLAKIASSLKTTVDDLVTVLNNRRENDQEPNKTPEQDSPTPSSIGSREELGQARDFGSTATPPQSIFDSIAASYAEMLRSASRQRFEKWAGQAQAFGATVVPGGFLRTELDHAEIVIVPGDDATRAALLPGWDFIENFATSYNTLLKAQSQPAIVENFELVADGTGQLCVERPARLTGNGQQWRLLDKGRISGLTN